MAIYVEGRVVGCARSARLDVHAGKVTLEGLDALARLFFSALVGPAGPATEEPFSGGLAICGPDGEWIEAPEAKVFSFSSGTGDLVLISPALRTTSEAPPLAPPG